MGGRRPGPAPNEKHRHRNPDPFVSKDGWTEIGDAAFDGAIPEIPAWVRCTDEARAVYAELARLPQAATWGAGTWLQLHLSLPLVGRYLQRPGSENFKAIISTLGASKNRVAGTAAAQSTMATTTPRRMLSVHAVL